MLAADDPSHSISFLERSDQGFEANIARNAGNLKPSAKIGSHAVLSWDGLAMSFSDCMLYMVATFLVSTKLLSSLL